MVTNSWGSAGLKIVIEEKWGLRLRNGGDVPQRPRQENWNVAVADDKSRPKKYEVRVNKKPKEYFLDTEM